MPTAKIDIVQQLDAAEDRGAYVRMTRRCVVTGLTETDPQILSTALGVSGVPIVGSSPTGFANLVCVRREARLADNCKTVVWIDCHYVSQAEARINPIAEGGTSVLQIETQTDRNRRQITVEHEFPADDPDYGTASDWGGEPIVQGGSISVFTTRPALSFTFLMAHDNPVSLSQNWASRINWRTWYNGGPLFWMCTRAEYKLHDASTDPYTYEWFFDFAYNNNTWIPKVVFIDPRTGKPPDDLTGAGYKSVDWYLTRDFNELFPSP